MYMREGEKERERERVYMVEPASSTQHHTVS